MTKCWKNSLITSLLLLYCSYVSSWRANHKAEEIAFHDNESRLQANLQANYSINVLPPHLNTFPVTVALEMSVVAIRELDERTETLTIDAWLKMQWNDSRLSWSPEEYGGIKVTRLSRNVIWHPDIKLFNRVKLSEVETQNDIFATVHHMGKVDWVVPSTFHSSCKVNLKMYPFDVQTCLLRFGSWSMNGFYIDMALLDSDGTIEFLDFSHENNQWAVVGSRAWNSVNYLPCCEEPFPEVNFEFQLRRRSPYYKQTILFPTLGVVALTLSTFWLPPNSVEKCILGGFNFLTLVIILAFLSWKLPPAGKTIPMIVSFCGNLILAVVASLILSVVSIIYGRAHYIEPPPNWMRISINSIFGKILCVNSPQVFTPVINHIDAPDSLELDGDDLKNLPSEMERQQYYTAQWLQGLQMIDRINFLIFLIIIAFSLAGAFTFNQ